jgi:hypothetical protein
MVENLLNTILDSGSFSPPSCPHGAEHRVFSSSGHHNNSATVSPGSLTGIVLELVDHHASVSSTRLSYLTVKFWIVVETRRDWPRIDRIPCEPICGHRDGYFEFGLASLWAQHPARNRRFPAGSLQVFGAHLAQPSSGKSVFFFDREFRAGASTGLGHGSCTDVEPGSDSSTSCYAIVLPGRKLGIAFCKRSHQHVWRGCRAREV